ncbi:MAG: type II toxin-antitoxin system Phd/YefM family antitoxin [Pseudomonadota bacterium]
MREVGAFDAKTHLAALLSDVEAGETIVITRRGKPVAKLGPLEPAKRERKPGFMKGRIKVPDDFDTMGQEEILAMFEGRDEKPRRD